MEKNNKYFAVYNKTTANVLRGLTGQRYYKFNDEDGKLFYSFKNDEKLQIALNMLAIAKKMNLKDVVI